MPLRYPTLVTIFFGRTGSPVPRTRSITPPSPSSTPMHAAVDLAVDLLRDELTAFLQALVRTPSVTGSEQAAQLMIAAKYRSLGLVTDIVESTHAALDGHPAFSDDGIAFVERINVIGRWPGTGGGRSLILNGHIDVVPPGDSARWTVDPWSGAIHDGRLYGRGACDMKSGLCSVVFAIQALQSIGFHPAGDVLAQSVVAEETGGIGTLTTIVHGYRADACIIAEPTNLKMWTAQSGALTFRITIHGLAAHAAMKSQGVSAIEAFVPILTMLQRLDVERHRRFQHPLFEDPSNIAPISVGILRAGDWHSTVPAVLVAEGRFGVFPGESVDAARAALVQALDEEAARHPWLATHPPQLEWFEGQFESGEVPVDAAIVQALARGHQRVTATDAVVGAVSSGTDARLFTRHAEIPTVLYGPGDVAQAHAADEFVSIDEVVQCTKVLAHTIIDWCGAHHVIQAPSTPLANARVAAVAAVTE